MARISLGALLLALATVGWWILRPGHPVTVAQPPQGVASAAESSLPDGMAVDASRRTVFADEGGSEPARAAPVDGGWRLAGRVLTRRGMPVPGARVRLTCGVLRTSKPDRLEVLNADREDYAVAVTAADGGFLIRLPGPPEPERMRWMRRSPGLVCDPPAGRAALAPLPDSFLEHGGERDLILPAGAAVHGRVVGPDGAPASFCRISSASGLWWTADAEGRFRAPLPATQEIDLDFYHSSGVSWLTRARPPRDEDLDLGEVRLLGSSRLTGRVVLPDGSQAPHLWLVATRDPPESGPPFRLGGERLAGHAHAMRRSDAEGWFCFAGLAAGTYLVSGLYEHRNIPLHAAGADRDSPPVLNAGPESDGHVVELPWRMLLVEAPEFSAGMGDLTYQIHGAAADAAEAPHSSEFLLLKHGTALEEDLPLVLLYDQASFIRLQAATTGGFAGSILRRMDPEPWLTRIALGLEPVGATGTILVRSGRSDLSISKLTATLRDPRSGLASLSGNQHRTGEGVELRDVPVGVWSLTVGTNSFATGAFHLDETFPVEVRGGETTIVPWTPREGGLLQVIADADGAAPGGESFITAMVLEGPAHVGNLLNFAEEGRSRSAAPSPRFPPARLMIVAGVLEPGRYRIRFAAEGFDPTDAEIAVEAGNVVRLESRLAAAP